ncbi:hypothetical protein GQ457_08G026720 [Hibiscus cannabinus]
MTKCLCLWCQVCTQRSWKQPYGVGLLVAGLDESGAHLYYNCLSGNYFKYQAFAIGLCSQAGPFMRFWWFRGELKNFTDASRDDLIKDALMAIRKTLHGETLKSFVCKNVVVRVRDPFHIVDQATVQQIIDAFEIVGGQEGPDAAVGQEALAAP